MKNIPLNFLQAVVFVVFLATTLTVMAADRAAVNQQQSQVGVSQRIIVKLKPALWTRLLSSAQVTTELMRPLSADTLNQLQTAAGVALSESHAISNGAHVITLQGASNRQDINQAIQNIRQLSNVEYVEEDRILTIQTIPNDTSYPSLWALQPLTPVPSPAPGGTGSYGADFETAWNITAGSAVVVAVVDTGITPHTDIGTVSPPTGNLISSGYTFISDCRIRGTCPATTLDASAYIAPSANASDLGDFITVQDMTDNPVLFPPPPAPAIPVQKNSSWHGTHVSGIIAALGNNSVGIIGGAYTSRILPVRVLGKGGGSTADIAEGIMWASNVHATIANPNPAKVINLSLGGTGACGPTMQNAIDAAVAAGAVIVVAAGNEAADFADHSPANCNNIISVAATGKDGSRALYSNFSSPASNTTNPAKISIAAPGGLGDLALLTYDPGIYSTINTGVTTPDLTAGGSGYGYKSGTSMATPHVAAAVALMIARNPALSPAALKTILTGSVSGFPSFPAAGGWGPYDCATLKNCGAGILNAQLAVQNCILPYSADTAIAATKGGGLTGGGCSIMSVEGNPDFSLLLALITILLYSGSRNLTVGKN
jgi:serine protease